MNKMIALILICPILSGFAHPYKLSDTSIVSFTSLLREMNDPKALANNPNPAYQLFQSSSWDREELKGKDDKGWFANKDYDNYIRKEKNGSRMEWVIMDVKGPGAIVRWWIPQISLLGNRMVRIYL